MMKTVERLIHAESENRGFGRSVRGRGGRDEAVDFGPPARRSADRDGTRRAVSNEPERRFEAHQNAGEGGADPARNQGPRAFLPAPGGAIRIRYELDGLPHRVLERADERL